MVAVTRGRRRRRRRVSSKTAGVGCRRCRGRRCGAAVVVGPGRRHGRNVTITVTVTSATDAACAACAARAAVSSAKRRRRSWPRRGQRGGVAAGVAVVVVRPAGRVWLVGMAGSTQAVRLRQRGSDVPRLRRGPVTPWRSSCPNRSTRSARSCPTIGRPSACSIPSPMPGTATVPASPGPPPRRTASPRRGLVRARRQPGSGMKALTWHGKRDVRVDDVPDPTIQEPTDAIIQVTSTGALRLRPPPLRAVRARSSTRATSSATSPWASSRRSGPPSRTSHRATGS